LDRMAPPALNPMTPPPTFQARSATPAAPLRAEPPAAKGDCAVWVKEGRLIGFLVSYDKNPNGEYYELRSGRLIVTSEASSSGNFLLLLDDTVSPMHAILRVSERGAIQVLDQLSENGTCIRRYGTKQEEQLSGEKGALENGDIVKFGSRKFNVCLVAVEEED
jgi:hypothetical protein